MSTSTAGWHSATPRTAGFAAHTSSTAANACWRRCAEGCETVADWTFTRARAHDEQPALRSRFRGVAAGPFPESWVPPARYKHRWTAVTGPIDPGPYVAGLRLWGLSQLIAAAYQLRGLGGV